VYYVVYVVTGERERRNNSGGTMETWIIADLGPAISLIDLHPNRCLARPPASHNLFMSIVSWFVDSCRSFISSQGIRRYFSTRNMRY